MQKSSFVIAIQTALLATSLLAAQSVERNSKVLLKEIRFTGDLGLPIGELREYTEYLNGHSLGRAKLLEEAPSVAAHGLRHRGYLKAQVTPQLHSLKRPVNSKDAEVALELTIKAGRQYRLKDMTFKGLSTELPQAKLREAFRIKSGDIADAEEIGIGIANLETLFRQKGQDVFVVPDMSFDDSASTVSLQFDIEK